MTDRGSDKHSARLDEQLEDESSPLTRGAPVEARAQESREAEPAADDQPRADSRVAAGPAPGEVDPDLVEARSDLARHLRPSAFPAGREDLVSAAEEEGAPEALLTRLRSLPEGEFENVEAVWETLEPS